MSFGNRYRRFRFKETYSFLDHSHYQQFRNIILTREYFTENKYFEDIEK